jgi:hypothetical protein
MRASITIKDKEINLMPYINGFIHLLLIIGLVLSFIIEDTTMLFIGMLLCFSFLQHNKIDELEDTINNLMQK